MQERARRAVDAGRISRFTVACALATIAFPALARAEPSAAITLTTSETFRGESTAGDDPALVLSANVDSDAGFFAGATASIAAGERDPRVAASSQYAGYALRDGETSFELAVVHRDYHDMTDEAYRRHYFEAFAGVARGSMKLRVYVSPDYLVDGRTTYYVEASARIARIEQWSLGVRGGLSLIPPDEGTGRSGLVDYEDWSVTLSRPVGKASLTLGVTGTNYPVIGRDGSARAFASLGFTF